jgi:FixJ family two-component response regulator
MTGRSSSAPTRNATVERPTVFVVDDDPSVRQSLTNLFESMDIRVESFESAPEFMSRRATDAVGCLVLDIRLPGQSGLDLQDQLARAHIDIPIIFVTGHGDIPITVRAMKAGAVEFLTKPYRDQDILDAVQSALGRARQSRAKEKHLADLRSRFEALSPREQEVAAWVASGLLNKQIAAGIGLAEITVRIHRSRVMKKMGVRSLPDLVRMTAELGISPAKP